MAETSLAVQSFIATLYRQLPSVLPEFLRHRRWFGGKARSIRDVKVLDVVPVHREALPGYLVLVRVEYDIATDDVYDIPLVRLRSGALPGISDPTSILTFRQENASEDIVLVDALSDEQFLEGLLDAITQSATFHGARGEVRAVSTSALPTLRQPTQDPLTPSLMKAEQSNTSVVYGRRLVLKIFRRVEEGINPDLEIGLFLTQYTSFRNVPTVAGHLEYLSRAG